MRNNKRIAFLLVLVMLLHLHTSCASVHGDLHSRKLLVSMNSVPVDKGKLSGARDGPERAIENGLRRKPPSSSNPTHNK